MFQTDFLGTVIARLQIDPETVRHVDCHLIVETQDERCDMCKQFRKQLNSLVSRFRRTNSTPTSICTNFRYMTSPQKIQRLKELQTEKHILQKNVARLKDKIAKHTNLQGASLSKPIEEDIISIASAHHHKILKTYPDNSFQSIFWKSQIENRRAKGKRWHPVMIKWCLLLRHQSSNAYEMLRKSGIQLPSQRTLRDYTHYYASSVGFSTELDLQLMDDVKFELLSGYQKFICVIGDEMHVKDNLVYNKFSGELTGFIDLDDISHHLLQLEEQLEGSESDASPSLATTVFVFMVRGLFSRIQFPYATFAAKSVSADQLLPLYMEALFRLERCGFRVIGITLDGYSANRRLMNLLSDSETDSKLNFKTRNPFATQRRSIFFFSDPPHLLKTIRNSFASSKRNLLVSSFF